MGNAGTSLFPRQLRIPNGTSVIIVARKQSRSSQIVYQSSTYIYYCFPAALLSGPLHFTRADGSSFHLGFHNSHQAEVAAGSTEIQAATQAYQNSIANRSNMDQSCPLYSSLETW